MLKRILFIVLITTVGLLNAVPVLAATTAIVSILGIPAYSGGILSFNVIYTSDTQMNLNWTVGGGVANVMVRAKYGSYPANPPDSSTAPSDGYLVYYGSDLSAVDTSMDMNQNAGTLYYSAWAQHADGSWYVVASTKSEESREVVLIGLILMGMLGSAFAIMKRNILFAIGGAVIWFFLIAYTRVNPLPNVVIGSGTDSLFIGICVAFSIGTMITVFVMNNNENRKENPPPDEHAIHRHDASASGYESTDHYQARLQSMRKRKKD